TAGEICADLEALQQQSARKHLPRARVVGLGVAAAVAVGTVLFMSKKHRRTSRLSRRLSYVNSPSMRPKIQSLVARFPLTANTWRISIGVGCSSSPLTLHRDDTRYLPSAQGGLSALRSIFPSGILPSNANDSRPFAYRQIAAFFSSLS